MSKSLQSVVNSSFAVRFALLFGRNLPPSLGYPLANRMASLIAGRHGSDIVRAVRANQWVVAGGKLSSAQLDQRVEETFRHTAHCLYSLYHNLNDDSAMNALVVYRPEVERLIENTRRKSEPMVIVGMHLSNFDFIMRATALKGMDVLAIAVASDRADSGYAWQNDLRRRAGMEIMPASMDAVKKALGRLKQGGSVLTGLDRPLPGSKHLLTFFGRRAALSVLHVHLALKAQVPLVVAGIVRESDGRYWINTSDPITMIPHRDRRMAADLNAERVLRVAEDMIRHVPHQWAMFHPVWPEALDEIP